MPELSPLGKKNPIITHYDASLLYRIRRQNKRDEIKISSAELPFYGADIWNSFELSWLNEKGKPMVAMARFIFPCESPYHIESKSFKFYLNSFMQTSFSSKEMVVDTLKKDLSHASGATVEINVELLEAIPPIKLENYDSMLLDTLDVAIDCYELNPTFLSSDNSNIVSESVCSNLLKANCLVTGQPDWASVQITYQGSKINHEGLLRYLVSYRNHQEFHEQGIERIFTDIKNYCAPLELTVEACFTRRGGLDINPFRTTHKNYFPARLRLLRQ